MKQERLNQEIEKMLREIRDPEAREQRKLQDKRKENTEEKQQDYGL